MVEAISIAGGRALECILVTTAAILHQISNFLLLAMDAKKRRLADLVCLKGVTSEALAAILQNVHDDPVEPVSPWCINKFLHDEFDKLKSDIELPIGRGKPFTWSVCSVPKLVAYFAAEAPKFCEVMDRAIQACQGAPLRGIIYLDEVTPGNILRPDNKRKFWAIYLGFEQVGANNLFREEMWLPIAMLRTKVAHQAGVSFCLKQLLRSILLQPSNLASVGTAIQLTSPTLLRLAITNILADEAALKAIWCSKGAGGLRCCMLCRNVVSMHADLTSGQEYIVDVSCSDPSRFEATSDSDMWATFDKLAREKGRLTKGRFEELEKAVGMTFDPESLLADMELRQHLKPCSSTMMDWMHNFLVHGITNLEVHAFLSCCRQRLGLVFADLHLYAGAAWLWPAVQEKHKIDDVFTTSREKSSTESFKSSASELLMLFPMLRHFGLTVVAPTKNATRKSHLWWLCATF